MEEKVLRLINEKYEEGDFKYHISAVVKNALLLADKLKADKDVVEMAAYLHDIARSFNREDVNEFVKKNEHHIEGAKQSEIFLKELGYDKKFIERVSHCVLTHRGRAGPNPETIEAQIVACADAMAHFDTFLDLVLVFMSGTLKTASFKMRSFPSIPKNFPVEEKSPIKPLASARGRRFFGKFFLIKTNDGSFENTIIELEKKMQRNWEKKLTIPEAKEMVKDKYNAIMLLLKSMKEYF